MKLAGRYWGSRYVYLLGSESEQNKRLKISLCGSHLQLPTKRFFLEREAAGGLKGPRRKLCGQREEVAETERY